MTIGYGEDTMAQLEGGDNMKKFVSLLLTIAMTLTMSSAFAYESGIYTGIGQGNNGNITVDVTFSGDAITNVKIVSHSETAGVCDAAIETIPTEIVTYQSLAVDAVTGATNTSKGILEAVASAVEQAGGDVGALKSKTISKEAGEAVDMTADVIVVGGGGAGMSAAVTAGQQGASVIVVEKAATLGGNTVISGGYMQVASAEYLQYAPMTDAQKGSVESYITMEAKCEKMAQWQESVKAQYDEYLASGSENLFDCPELHMLQTYVGGDYLGAPDLIEMMCNGAVEAFTWLQEQGLEFKPTTMSIVGSIWQRCKTALNYSSGNGYIATLRNTIDSENLPVEFVFNCEATHLITEDGKVVGVEGQLPDGTQYTFHANKGVIMATGGFSANVEMRQEYDEIWGNLGEGVPTTNTATITGDGIKMGLEVDAALVDMGQIQLLPLADPETGASNSIVGNGTCPYINQEGERFVNESGRRDVLAAAILKQTGSYCYVLSTPQNANLTDEGANIYGIPVQDLIDRGLVFVADTIPELAEKVGVPADTLQKTIEDYNQAVADNNDPLTGRTIFSSNSALEMDGPFYACKRAPAVHHTMGGLKVNTKNQVLDSNGDVISGFYAAGEVTGGFHGSNRLGGNAIAEVITTGRNAANNLLSE